LARKNNDSVVISKDPITSTCNAFEKIRSSFLFSRCPSFAVLVCNQPATLLLLDIVRLAFFFFRETTDKSWFICLIDWTVAKLATMVLLLHNKQRQNRRALFLAAALFSWLAVEGFVPPSAFDARRGRVGFLQAAKKKKDADTTNGEQPVLFLNGDAKSDPSSFAVGILGDLHIDPRKMDEYEEGRDQWVKVLDEAKETVGQDHVALVSLGDLGESKNCDHNDLNPSELFAGTSLCHEMAADYLGSFGVPYEVIGGNHDLEGIDEFKTDAANLKVFLEKHGKPTPQFCREIADKTLLVGLCSTIFRDAKYTSHEVIIDREQIAWFEDLCQKHPAEDGWKLFVFSHAPPNGSGLRVLQENHVINGCCWLNHSSDKDCRKFIELVREHRCIKAWFSGHFHLGQDYQDS